ncbi:MAG: tRNA-(ms[2]io[6]A)-hydroxylase [Saprospiraceae bacterium]|nr:tRNA-(ms[2]io[6]A)-hydroxylase [Saprospiraceae bacterium]
MKLNLDIKIASSPEWLEAVMADFTAFLQDHADCERKASAMAMSFVAKYPDKTEIIPELIETAIEELQHFEQVYRLLADRGAQLSHSIGEDPYAKALLRHCHSGIKERFMDRLLIASVMETRGAERFKMVADVQADPAMARFYKDLWTSEAKHGHIFVKMALQYFERDAVYQRLDWWLDREAEIIKGLNIRPALH